MRVERRPANRLTKCDLSRPREYYENLLAYRLKEFEKVEDLIGTSKRHNALCRLEYVEAQLRYYDKYKENLK